MKTKHILTLSLVLLLAIGGIVFYKQHKTTTNPHYSQNITKETSQTHNYELFTKPETTDKQEDKQKYNIVSIPNSTAAPQRMAKGEALSIIN